LKGWFALTNENGVYSFIQKIAREFLLDTANNHEDLVARVEVVRTILHLVLAQIEKNPKITLKEFLSFIQRLEEYGQNIPLASSLVRSIPISKTVPPSTKEPFIFVVFINLIFAIFLPYAKIFATTTQSASGMIGATV
jgi:hypothetical protein